MDHPIFYFDFLSPYSFLMWELLKKRQLLESFEYKPIILGKIFKEIGQKNIAEIKPKRDYLFKKALRIAAENEISLLAPLQHPFNSLYALRMTTQHATETKEQQYRTIDCLWKALWQSRIDAGNPDELIKALEESDINGKKLYEKAFETEAKKELVSNLKEALEVGVFGVPTLFDGKELFWGVESLEDYINYTKGNDPLDRELYDAIKASIDEN